MRCIFHPCWLALLGAFSGCAGYSRPATAPLRTIAEPAPCATAPDTLLVLLPGSYSRPEDFIHEGFVRQVRQQRIASDVLLVDAHVGYYQDKTILTRLRADVIAPARAQGYRHIWLAGISIGGVGAMLYADEHPDDVDGLVVLAPYLGSRLYTLEIRNAGGLRAWPGPGGRGDGEVDTLLWRWLKAQTDPADGTRKLPLFQGYGLEDRFVYNNRLLSEALPPQRVYTTEGGHDWPAWKALWERIVQAVPLRRDARCAAPAPAVAALGDEPVAGAAALQPSSRSP